MLIGRHGLSGELTADPIGLLGEDHAPASPGGRKGRGTAAYAATDDDDISPAFGGALSERETLYEGKQPTGREEGASVHAGECTTRHRRLEQNV